LNKRRWKGEEEVEAIEGRVDEEERRSTGTKQSRERQGVGRV